jgi:dipeptidyl aminopeptidase/acylaminoacyl peptidase
LLIVAAACARADISLAWSMAKDKIGVQAAGAMARPVRPQDFSLYALISEPDFSPDGRRLVFSSKKANLKDDSYDSDIYVADVRKGGAVRFTSGGKDSGPRWSPDGKSILLVSKRNMSKDEKGNALYVISAEGGEATQVLRSEDGIDSPEWAPDSRSVYYTSFVTKKEKDDVKVIKRPTFWFNGQGFIYNRRKHLFRVDVGTRKPRQVTKGSLDVGTFAVSGDGRRVAYAASMDDLRPYVSDIFVIPAAGGRPSKLTKSNMEVTQLAWSPDGKKLAFAGNDFPSGFASHTRLWAVDPKTKKLGLIEGVDRNKSNGLNSDARSGSHGPGKLKWTKEGVYYVQADGGAVHLYRLPPGGEPELLVGGERSVEGFDAHEGRVAYLSMDDSHLEEVYVTGRGDPVTSLNEEVYKELKVLSPERVTFKAGDGERIEGWVLLPEGKGRVPGILYVHGGPKTAFGYSYMHEFQAFAGAGYAVIYLNPRGSDGYSEKFADIRGKYGTRDFDDLMEGLDHVLKEYPRIDGGRLGIAGGSYGGFMTNWAIGHTKRFRAAVTDRSIASWVSMWGTSDIGPWFTSDQIGGDPWNAEEKLLSDSPLRYAPQVETPLMLVHSMEDYRCWMVEGLQFFTALKVLGKEAELVLFPGENHDLSRAGKPKHRVARLNNYIRWFDEHLKRR